MQDITLNLLLGFISSLIVNIPIGPNGGLAFLRAYTYGWKAVLPVASASTLVAFLYIILSFYITSYPVVKHISTHITFQIINIILILGMSYFFYQKSKRYSMPSQTKQHYSAYKLFCSSLLISITNPKSIILYPVLFINIPRIFSIEQEDARLVSYNAFLISAGGVTASCFWWGLFTYFCINYSQTMSQTYISKTMKFLSYFLIALVGLKIYTMF